MGEHTLRLKVAAAVLAAFASTTAAPVSANAAVRPAVSGICNYSLAIFPSYNSAGPTAVVSGSIQFCGSSTWIQPYLVIWKTNAAGVKTFGGSGIGQAVYQCQGTTVNTFSMDGEIPDGVSYTMPMACG